MGFSWSLGPRAWSQTLLSRPESLPEPDSQRLDAHLSLGRGEGQTFEFFVGRLEDGDVALEKKLRGGHAYPFVPVHERMIQYERVHQRRGLSRDVNVEIGRASCRERVCQYV